MPKFSDNFKSRLKRLKRSKLLGFMFKNPDSDIKSSLDNATKRNRHLKVIFFTGIAVFIIVVIAIHESQPEVAKPKPKKINATVDIPLEQQWMGKAQHQVDALAHAQQQSSKATTDKLGEMTRTLKHLDERIDGLNKRITSIKDAQESQESQESQEKQKEKDQAAQHTAQNKKTVRYERGEQGDIKNPALNNTYNNYGQGAVQNGETKFIANPDQMISSSVDFANVDEEMIGYESPQSKKAENDTIYKDNLNAGALPLGSWAKVSLINGGDFPAGVSAQGQPKPVFVKILSDFVMPNGFKYSLKGCTGMGAGYGGYSEKRVYIKLHQISCVGKGGMMMVSDHLVAQVMDSDAKVGINGELHENEAYKAWLATIAGVFSGVASVAASSQGTTYNGAQGVYSVLSGQAAVNASMGNAAASGLGELSKFFIDKLNSMQPYITINTGRIATIIVSQTKPLHWVNRQESKIKMTAPVEIAKPQDIEAKPITATTSKNLTTTNTQGLLGGQGNHALVNNMPKAPEALSKSVNHALEQTGNLAKRFGDSL